MTALRQHAGQQSPSAEGPDAVGKPIRARHAAGAHAAAECVSGDGARLGSVSGTACRSLSSPAGDRTRIPIWAGRPVEDRHSGVHPAGGSTQIPVWARTWPEPRAAEASVPRHDPARPPVAGPDSAGPDRPVAVASAPARSDQEARLPAADPLRRFAHDPGSGTQLPSSVEEALRPSFGPGIGAVRVHTDPTAEGAARHARAGLHLRRAHRLRAGAVRYRYPRGPRAAAARASPRRPAALRPAPRTARSRSAPPTTNRPHYSPAASTR